MTQPECVCPSNVCLGTDSDSGTRIECAACLALDPELPCLRDTCWCDGPDCGQTPCVEEQGKRR